MNQISPKNYDYLWTDHDVNFIFTSCYLFEEFRKSDIILVYDYKDKGLKFYLSRNQRKKFSRLGLRFFNSGKEFLSWRLKILNDIKNGKKLIAETKKNKNKIKYFTNDKIKNEFLKRVALFQKLGGNYFYTEFFFLDEIEKITSKSNKLTDHLREVGKIKFKARNILNSFYNYNIIFKPYIVEMIARIGRKDLPWLSFKEIADIIDGNGKCIIQSKRDRKYWVLAQKNNWQLIEGEKAKRLMEKLDDYFFNKKITIIKGHVANKGSIIKGRVIVIKTIFSDNIVNEIKKVKKGDILVAATTGPEIITAIKKAGAIITNEGGITSHAAIISRELNIPCIIGTKIATKVLKDGDLVEVDANKGIVKILK
ncbi:MAG TPA: PEP-utilizing enzyme [Candidatus Moranbacteria bacterium]|nr:PEP-utilizing enzyme [Candidatus Moranbacteria bacterium]